MGVGRREVAALWALALALACAQHPGGALQRPSEPGEEQRPFSPIPWAPGGDPLLGVTILPPLKTIAVVRALNPAHNGRVCSTWGDSHYKTFDGDVFRFPGRCNYVFSAHCGATYEDFNVQLRRGQDSNATMLSKVTMKLNGMVLELTKGSVLVNGHLTQLPFSQSGVLIEHSVSYLKVVARLGLVFMWNQDDSLLLELDPKYSNQTCGLCGDFNGVPIFNEFISHGVRLSPIEFGSLQKMDGPTEQCQDPVPVPTPVTGCSATLGLCEELLLGERFLGCRPLVDASRYVQACQQDLCLCREAASLASCACHTLAEYSRQCAHAGGLPLDWRGPDLCPQTCPLNMQYRECGSPCVDTCSNLEHSQACEEHCVAGCFCPEGMVLDDIGQKGCVPVSQCPCAHNGATYAPGANYSTECSTCTCSGGRWSCQEVACPGTCSVLGGAHFSTFDEKPYTVHGDCSYVLAKPCNGSAFTVLAELRRCGLTDSESCLRGLTLSLGGGRTVVTVQAGGEVFVDQAYVQLPILAANITVFRPSTFFIIAQTNLGLQVDVQLVPTMQVFLRLAPELRGLTCGLCGNFNQNQADDFRTLSGVVEGTAAAFANTWKTQAACPNVRNSFEDPCALSVENEKYAQHWCSRLTDLQGPFAQCHATVSPGSYYSHCLFDTCNCERSEDCLCAALSAYVHACAARGVLLHGWRAGVCTKPMENCPKSMTYHDHISTCQPTCRALSNEDPTCGINFVPVDGCTCPQGTFLDDTGKCVPATSCPCYHGALVIPSGESVHQQGAVCTCTKGMLTCIGGHTPDPVCAPPMVYVDCRNSSAGATGAACQKSCHTLDMDCYSPQCVPGCVCPDGLVADSEGGCIAAADCPCMHNEASYQAGQTIRVGCNTCTCQSRMWQCTDKPCLATCAVYGDGHYFTFDGQRYSFSGNCEYTLVQDHCGGNGSSQGTFRVVTENIPCGTTGTTCSKAIKIFLGDYELQLSDGKVEVTQKATGQEAPYAVRQVGIYLAVDTEAGLVLLWDKKTSIFLRLSPEFKGRVCGLCGNFDDNALNDFTTRSQSVVGDALEFGNSWKLSPSCQDATAPRDPCTANPYRKSWAQKQCSLLHSTTFQACHAHVDPTKYYEACVSDACACDSGGDCECFCTAVAAYAQACREVDVCVSWRTPDVCPLFCDYYNAEGQCEWHYQPCGAPCLRTCRNPRGQCWHDTQGLEGCYPRCPAEAPIFDEDNMQCVAACPSPPPPLPCQVQGKAYWPGTAVPSDKNCYSCICTESGVQCTYDADACVCTYGGQHFRPGDVIYHTTDGTGGCISAHCGANSTIERRVYACGPSTPAPPTTFSFSTPMIASSSTGWPSTSPISATGPAPTGPLSTAPPTAEGSSPRPQPSPASVSPHPGCGEDCQWSPWLDLSRPGRGIDSGDFDTLDNLRAHGYPICQAPRAVECRVEDAPEVPLQDLGPRVECTPTVGLTCYNKDQASGLCDNYQIRVLCCTPRACSTSSGQAPTAPWTARSTTPGATSTQTGHTAHVHTAGPSTSANTRRTPDPGNPTAVKTTPSTPSLVPGSTTTRTATAESSATPEPSEGPSQPTSPQPSQIPCIQEFCSWTDWIDGSYPEASIDGGDFDTFQNLRSKGYKFCDRPRQVKCRAVNFPDVPLAALGQNLLCNSTVGLLCRNRDQLPPICYNYEVQIQCCEWRDVCTGMTTSVMPQDTHSTTQAARTRSEEAQTLGTQVVSTQHSSGSSVHVSPAAKVTASTHITSPGTSPCQPRCTWTKWFDVDFPRPGPHGGDVETYSNILSSGEKICRQPDHITDLECRAENHPEVSIQSLGQVVQCSPDVGLVCRNRDQTGAFKMCLNYEIRVLCCEPREGCPTYQPVTVPSTPSVSVTSKAETTSHVVTTRTTSVPETSTTPEPETSSTSVPKTSTSPVPQTSTTPVPKPSTTPVPETSTTPVPKPNTTPVPETSTTPVPKTSSTSAPAPATTHSTPGTTSCQPRCTWTKWFDVDFPRPGPHGGDVETYSNILSSGEKICRQPDHITDLECRAENHPEVSIQSLGQVVQCSPDVGLVCRNRDQTGAFKMCLNYEIRVLCCEPREGCPTYQPVTVPSTPSVSVTSKAETTSHVVTTRTTSVPETSTTPEPETSSTSVPKTSTSPVPQTSTTPVPKPSTTPVPETSTTPVPKPNTTPVPETSTTPVPKTSSTSAPAPATTHSTPGTTSCQPRCTWTKWFDVDFPRPGPHGGDVETYSNILSSGEKICRQPDHITDLECRAENHPEVSIQSLGQVVQCSPDVGLVCRNRDQTGAFKMCLNYEIRVLCCEPREGCPTYQPVTVPSTPSVSVTSKAETTSHVVTTRTTSVPETSTTPEPETSSTSVPKTSTSPVPQTSTTPVPKPSTTPVPETSTTPVPKPNTTPVPETSTTPVPKTSSTSAPAPATTHSTPGTTSCQPRCTWTKWFDVDFPRPGPHGGDVETYSNILSSGEKICRQPDHITDLECRAENHPEVSIQSLGQVVQCSPDVGLVCRNRDQTGAFKMCLNYEIRVLCCEPREGCPTYQPVTVPSTPSVSVTSKAETTSHVVTTRTTSVPETSTTPEPETSSTSVPKTSTSPVPQTSTTPVPKPSTTPVPETSTTPVPKPNTTPVPETSTTPVPKTSSTSAPAPATTHSTPGTTSCQPRCTWTKWFDVDFPRPGPHGGDVETYSNILSSGEKICRQPDHITDLECRAENHPEVSIQSLGQVVQCSPDVGLVCRNRDQTGAFKMCLNYEIRVLCCEPREGCPTYQPVTVPSTPSVSVTSKAETTSHVVTTRTTSVPETSTTPEPETSSTSVPKTSTSPVPQTSTTPVPKPSTTPVPETSTTPVPKPNTTPVPETSTTPVPKTSSTSAPAPATTHSTPGTTSCQPRCTWTKWFDVDFPRPGPHGGDVETYSNILSSGEKICRQPDHITDLECRAENHPEVSIQSLGQVVQCSPDVGLVCRNRDQTGAFKMCLNYEIRVLCCEPREGCPTYQPVTVPSTPSVSVTSKAETTSHVVTTRTTSVPETSTTPEPETSSTSVPKTSTSPVPQTSTTPVPKPSTTPVPETSTTPVPKPNTTPVPETSTTPVPKTSSTSAPAPATTHSTPGTTSCQPRCTWTKWFDVDFPRPGPHGGDVETYSNILSSGEKICRQPDHITDLECRAENHPEVSIQSLGQVVQCSPDVGLVCRNRDQTGAFKMCLNYEIRVLCCEPREGCPTYQPVTVPSTPSVSVTSKAETTSHVVTTRTTSVPETSTTPEPETSSTSVPKTSTSPVPQTSTTPVPKPSTTPVPETSTTPVPKPNTTPVPETSTTPVPKTSSTSAPAPATTHSTPGTTSCQPRCTWTKWFDVDFPRPGPHGGDVETYSNILSSGEKICRQPDHITDLECRAENHPEVSIQSLGQVVQCSPDVGLVCRNRDQTGAFKMCLNYEIRVLCCEPREGCPTYQPVTVPSTPSVSVTSKAETTSHVVTTRTTSVPETSTTPEPETSSTSVPKTSTSPVPQTSTTPVPKPSTTPVPETSTTPVPKPNTTPVPETSTTPVPKTSSTSAPAPATTHSTPGTTSCQPRCTWTKWFDVDFPRPGPHGGDVETYSNILSSGEKICRQPDHITDLECRAENHPEVSIQSLGQVVQCSPDVGLVCRNRDQTGAFKMCLNYEIRVLCCEPREGCPTYQPVTVPSTPSVSVTSKAETTSHVVTTRTTSVPETSTTPEPETSSTSVPKTSTSPVPQTSTTPVPKPSTTPVPETSTTPVPKPNTTPVPETSTTPVPKTSSTSAPAPATTHSTPGTTSCQPRCTWTKWFDVDFPRPGPHGGDVETYSNILSSGEKICRQPDHITDLECRAENHPEVSIQSLGQVVQCSPDVGLVCRNRDQTGAFKMCLNYEIRVLCCEPREGCPTYQPVTVPSTPSVSVTSKAETTSHVVTTRTTSVPETSTTPEPETSSTSVPKTSTSPVPQTSTTPVPKPSTTPVPETSTTPVPKPNTTPVPETSTTPVPKTSSTSAPAPATTHSTPGTTSCQPRCTWTKWFDVDFPRPGPHGGDVETYSNILSSGEKICRQPDHITDLECRAENHPEVSIQSLGQVVQCSPDVGLVCRNRDQTGAFKMCLNYEIRVLCCEPREGCPTYQPVTVPSTPSVSVTSKAETTSHVVTTRTTSVPETSTTPEPETSSTSVPKTSTSPVPQTSTTPVPKPSTTPVPETSTTPVPKPNTTPVPETSTTPVPKTSSTSAPAPATTHSTPGTTSCQPRCTWTKWFDVDFPRPGPHGGDVETYSNILSSGEKICRQPDHITDLECRAENHPEVSIQSLGQVVQCSPDVGLVCRNRDQTGAFKMCLNYEIRVLCCEPREGCPTYQPVTVPSTPSVSVTSKAETTSHVVTTRTTSVPETSTTPEPETSSTSVPKTSTSPVPQTSTTPVPKPSTTPVPETSTTPVPKPNTTPVPETSTTPVPKTSSTSAPAPATTHSTPGTTSCQPRCTWTKWFDVDFPRPGPHGGDVETYSNILSSGEKICRQPDHITDLECRAENHPEVSIQSLGQVVQCSPDVGLVCRNRDQTGAFKMCLNYEIRVLCCEPREGCPTYQPVTVPSTPSVSVTSKAETTSHVVTTRTTSVPETSTTPEPETSSTSVPKTSTSPVPQTSTTPVPKPSTTPVPETSTTPVPKPNTTPVPETSTTPVPKTSSTSAPAPATTHSTPGTTSCQPRCTWTKWFDVDFPRPGPHGGDVETYSNILSSGEKICRQPDHITDLECRAENHPEVSIQSLGQVVQCSPDVGLVCRNRDQTGAFKMCLNYEIRVLCCEPREGCLLTSVPPHMTSSVKSLPTSESSSRVPAVTTFSPSSLPAPTCYCSVSHKLYPAGSIIYQVADLAGHCYYAVCSLDCHVVRQIDRACPTSTVPPTPTFSTPGSSLSAPVPITTQGCPNAVPPRMKGDTWAMPNCSQATCEGNNVITLQPRLCPKVQEPTCANGYPALRVADEDGCCQHYQCQCVCSGWGDPHYITFDGTYYTFLDNCTYVLVQQIVPVYGHFRVLIDNYFCDSEDGLSCPQSIIVEYRQDRVVLTRRPVRGVMTNEILFNNKAVQPGFTRDGIVVSQIGIKMYVSIPEIGVQVMFSGLIFSVEVPFSKFANNTEGQCGTCTDNQKDECRLPGGAVVASCSDMSWHWKVTNPNQTSCHGPPPTPPTGGPTTTPTPCPPSPVCQLILSDVFKPCHTMIPPRPYYEGCVFDQCHMTEPDVVCSGLEMYASLCMAHGLCIDWRGQTNHTCPFTCPADKEYRPCGPSNPSYCYGGNGTRIVALEDISPITEGCFCPEGQTIFSASTEVCVPVGCPRCLGPQGEPVELGHTVTFDCQECTCEGSTWTMSCRRQPCPLPPACLEPGFVPVPVAPQASQCCPQYTCVCNASYCPALSGCPEGSLQTVNYEKGACCPSQKCSWTVCSVNGTLYQPGAVVSSSLCQTCRCEVPSGPQADTFRISCETETCSTHCPMGFEYRAQSGRCCGSCVQVACVVNASDGSAHLFPPGESWSDSGDRCVTHQCEKHQDGLVVVTMKKTCPSLTCPADRTRLSEDGCCLTCSEPEIWNRSTCAVYHKLEVIQVQGCSSTGPVPLAYCKGNCGDTTSMFSLAAGALEHNCSCCRELRASPRNVTLRCADGSHRAFSYTQVEECGCASLQCDTRGDLGQGHTEGPPRSRRWSRRARASPAA